MVNGKIVEAVTEKVFKQKNDERYQRLSIEYIMKKYNLRSKDLDLYVLSQNYGHRHEC